MKRTKIDKGIGGLLILSSLYFLAMSLWNIPESFQSMESWAPPGESATWFAVSVIIQLVFLISRFALGYFIYQGKGISSWLFFPLVLLTAMSGYTGIAIAVVVLVFRFWPQGVAKYSV